MCTAFSFSADDHYFGRNLDLDHHYNEEVVITPRNYLYSFRHASKKVAQYAMIGIATVIDNYPLYYEAINEKGLCVAGLNFPGNAVYHNEKIHEQNIASFELIPWILSQCKSTGEAKALLEKTNICNTSFRNDLPTTPLHWIVSDQDHSIGIEPMQYGLAIMENPSNVLTNSPPLPYHLYNLNNYLNLTAEPPNNRFSTKLNLAPYSLGMGAIGLPGDASSSSRFIRCVFHKENMRRENTTEFNISQVFHLLDSVAQYDGCVKTSIGFEKTRYSICCNATKGIFYYTTYENRQISAIDLWREDLNGSELIRYPLLTSQKILYQN